MNHNCGKIKYRTSLLFFFLKSQILVKMQKISENWVLRKKILDREKIWNLLQPKCDNIVKVTDSVMVYIFGNAYLMHKCIHQMEYTLKKINNN